VTEILNLNLIPVLYTKKCGSTLKFFSAEYELDVEGEEEDCEVELEEEEKKVEKLVLVCQPVDTVWEGRMAVVLALSPEVND
jgi:hypothetical protein